MSTVSSELNPRFPIGKFDAAKYASFDENVAKLAELPTKLRDAVAGLTDEQLETPYRPDGWTLRQTVHHVADSHLNTLVRFKLALTEDSPTIHPYYEERWAELGDSRLPVDVSLGILDGLHARLVALLQSLSTGQLQREFVHPETGGWSIERAAALYAWHSQHHTAHITTTRERHGW
jgi:hypothetical protein